MADGILAVKLNELDQQIGRIYARIEAVGTADHERIREELKALNAELEESERILRKKMKYSKAGVVARFSEAYDELSSKIKQAETDLGITADGGREGGLSADEKILYAEYSLDFAMQAVDHALLISLEAIDDVMTEEESEAYT